MEALPVPHAPLALNGNAKKKMPRRQGGDGGKDHDRGHARRAKGHAIRLQNCSIANTGEGHREGRNGGGPSGGLGLLIPSRGAKVLKIAERQPRFSSANSS